ncbi:hypothetical protein HDU98_003345, partial [Podochytrium sp. JEL0797]
MNSNQPPPPPPTFTDLSTLLHQVSSTQSQRKLEFESQLDQIAANLNRFEIAHHSPTSPLHSRIDALHSSLTCFTSLPREVAERILSWVEPKQVWKLRGLSKAFNVVLSTESFARMNLARFVPPPDLKVTKSMEPSGWDLIYLDAPVTYQQAHVERHWKHLTDIWWLGEEEYVGCEFIPEYVRIPAAIMRCKNLSRLTMCDSLTGPIPVEIGFLASLTVLELQYNLTGNIPTSLGQLVRLTKLDLSSNPDLSGTLPRELGCLEKLEHLNISVCSISGEIPSEWGSLANLQSLCLRRNRLSGLIPASLGRLTRLKVLDLQNNNLVGEIPISLSRLISLTTLDLRGNAGLSGRLPRELGRLERLETLDIAFASISGEIPSEWGSLANLESLCLSCNRDQPPQQHACIVCECAKCRCTHCRCNMETPLVTQRGILLRVALPSSPSASLASEAKSVPSCVAFEAQRAKCSMRVRCAFVDVKAALLKGALEVKSVVFKEKEEKDKPLKEVVIAVYFKDAPNLDLWTTILNDRGYSVSALPMPSLSHPRSHKLAIQIVGISCSSCTDTVASALTAIPGVLADSIVVNLQATESEPVVSHLPPQTIGEALFNINASELPPGTADLPGLFETKLEGLGFTVLKVQVTLVHTSFPDATAAASLAREPAPERLKTDVYLAGLTCASCVQSLTNAFKSIPGIHSTEISLLPFQRAFFVHDPAIAHVQVILETIENCGFEALHHSSLTVVEIDSNVQLASLTAHDRSVTNSFLYIDGPGANAEDAQQAHLTTTKLDVSGMTCASCVASVERILLSLDVVDSATVSLLTNRAVVTHDSNIIGARRLVAAVEDAGFVAGLTKEGDLTNLAQQQSQKELDSYSRSALLAFRFALPAAVLDTIIGMMLSPENPARQWVDVELVLGVSRLEGIMFLLATPVQFWLGMRFYVGAWRSLRYAGSANMDVLVALGTSAAYFYSTATLLVSLFTALHAPIGPAPAPQHQYFETSILLIFFILFGKYLETYAKQRTGAAVTQLLNLTPDTAILVHLVTGESMQSMQVEMEEE